MIYRYTLTYGASSEILTVNPMNWDSIGGSFVRSPIYHGFIRKQLTGAFRFSTKSGGGGQFILDAYEERGLEAEITLTIDRRNPQTWGWTTWFTGVIDIKPETFFEDKDNRFVECEIMDSAKQNKFMSRDEINYDVFSLLSSDNVTVQDFTDSYKEITYLPIDIYLNAEFDGNIIDTGTLTTVANDQEVEFTGGDTDINQIGDRLSVENGTTSKLIYTNSTTEEVSLQIKDLVFSSSIDCTFTANTTYDQTIVRVYTRLIVRDSGGTFQDDLWVDYFMDDNDPIQYTAALESLPKNVTYTHDQDDITSFRKNVTGVTIGLSYDEVDKDNAFITVPIDGYVELVTTVKEVLNIGAGDLEMDYDVQNTITSITLVEGTDGEPQSTVRGMFVHEAMTRLIQLATGETDVTKLYYSDVTGRTDSEFMSVAINGEAADDFVTNGKLIRQYPYYPLNLNIRDLFLTLDGIYNLGMAYDNLNERFYIDTKDKFYNTNFLFDIGEVAELKITPLNRAYYSKILSGQKNKVEYEELNGANEYNVDTEHSISIPVADTLDIRTPYNTDSIGQELARRNPYSEDASLDTKFDENVYLTRTNGSQTVQNGTSVTGFSGVEGYYNIAFAPRECILRWTNWIKAALWRSANVVINFIRSQKDTNITYTNEDGNSVNEQDQITEGEMLDAVIQPEMFEFKRPITEDELVTLTEDPHGVMTFSQDGTNYAMFLEELQSEDYKRKGTWKGIRIEYDAVATDTAEWENGNYIQFENGNTLIWS